MRRHFDVELSRLAERINGLDRLVDEKFVRHGTMLAAQADRVALALAAAEKAIDKAEVATERRLQGMNEFRDQLSDQAATLMPRKEAEQLVHALAERMEAGWSAVTIGDQKLDDRLKTLEQGAANQQGRFAMVGVGLAVVVVIVNVAIALLTR